MSQLEDLQYMGHAHTVVKQTDDIPLDDRVIPDPVGQRFERRAEERAGVPAELSTTASSTIAKRAGSDLEAQLIKNRFGGITDYGMKAALNKAVRTETTVAPNGDRWESVYDANGLVSARQVDGDGGELAKRAGSSVEIQKLADGDFWKNTYRDGELVEMELHYANGDIERFDGDGNELAA